MSTESTQKPAELLAEQRGYEVGHEDGLRKGLTAVVNRLQTLYIDDPGRPDRGSVEGNAILAVGRDMLDFSKKVLLGEIKLGDNGE